MPILTQCVSCVYFESDEPGDHFQIESKLSGKAKRVNVTLPERLLAQIDSFAARHGDTRSGLLAHAALEYVAAHDDR